MIFLSILIFILAMSLPFFKTQITPLFFTRIAALALIYAGVLSLNALHIQSIGSGIGIYSSFFQVTYFNLFMETFIYFIGALILCSWPLQKNKIVFFNESKKEENILITGLTGIEQVSKEYSILALFSTLGGSFLLSSGDLLSMYLSIELQSFGLYILATIYRDSGPATGAGLKYFLLGGLSSCLILLGASLIYSFTGTTNFESLYSLISVISMPNTSINLTKLVSPINFLNIIDFNNFIIGLSPIDCTESAINTIGTSNITENILSPQSEIPISNYSLTDKVIQGISLGLILIVVGFLFKIAGAPFHNWSLGPLKNT